MVSWDRITELRDEVGDDDLAEVIALFCEEVEEVLEKLEGASSEDLPAHLHFLKGSAANIGFHNLSARCHDEEIKLRQDPSAKADVVGIRDDYANSKAELNGLL
jgi:HPt (histidine-containing phosphotransfer) domain-containing protein